MWELLCIEDDLKRMELLQSVIFNDEPDFDIAAELAASICNTPIAVVTFVKPTTQKFLGRFGTKLEGTPIRDSICKYTLVDLEKSPLILNNLSDISELRENALIHDFPYIQFYCGIPFSSKDDVNIGALCVIDTVPRQLSEQQIFQLKLLRNLIEKILIK